MEFTLGQSLLILVGGFIAGIINGSVGGGSLLTYPLLVAGGLPPVLAAATNTTGLAPGNAAALIPHRKGEVVPLRPHLKHAAAHSLGALAGGIILILLPEKVFEFIVPILLVVASALTLRKPRVESHPPVPVRQTLLSLVGSGVYQGYFGPGQGVIAIAVLLRDGRLTMPQVIVVKNLCMAFSNVVVASLFILTGHVIWHAAILLTISVFGGAWLGGHLTKYLRADVARGAVAAVGLVSAAWFVLGR